MSEVIRGDTTLWDIPFVDDENAPLSLNGCSVWVTVKSSPDDSDAEALYQHSITIDSGGAVVHSEGLTVGSGGTAAGVLVQELTPEESALFETGDYTYDIQIMMPDGRIYTPVRGDSESVVPDWTRDITPPEEVP